MNIIKKILGIKEPQPINPACSFEVKIGTVSYKASSNSLNECKESVEDIMRKIVPAPIDYIE